MKWFQKIAVALFAIILFASTLGPIPSASAIARILTYSVYEGGDTWVGQKPLSVPYLIAGRTYRFSYTDDSHFTTTEIPRVDFALDNNPSWFRAPGSGAIFQIPIDPAYLSVRLRLGVLFKPFIGDNSYDERILGPYKVLQPSSPSDLVATPNNDGTVKVTWTDNTNMESYYEIKRDGPDGTKTFVVSNTEDYIGPLVYEDKATAKKNDIIYAYTVTPIVDKYTLTDAESLGWISTLVRTKVKLIIDPDIFGPIDIDIILPDVTSPIIKPDTPIIRLDPKFTEIWSKELVNIDKIVLNRISLNKNVLTLQKGQSDTLTATILPVNAVNKKVVWSSANPDIATVDNSGKVTAVNPGIAKIIAKSDVGGYKDICTVTVEDPAAGSGKFKDTVGHWAEDEIATAVKLGFASGYTDGSFKPNGGVTRAEFATLLIKALNPAVAGAPLTFKDKNKIAAWALPYVEKAVALGIISGYTDGTFRPGAGITHTEMVSMVVRASKLALSTGAATGYADEAAIPKWAKDSVATAVKHNMIQAEVTPGNKFAPAAPSTRAEAVSVILGTLLAMNPL
ncbi:S-layer homology domain-containing protein [Paenibacillus sp. YIM B09110]|uniref:S-layer homology domain-containing protein n=1 Tax=Paenibacillus sp. YIM B09110 TaxID=3126102 RepID=UPI00301BF769